MGAARRWRWRQTVPSLAGWKPSQGEEMLAWMARNEHVWRSDPLYVRARTALVDAADALSGTGGRTIIRPCLAE